MASTWRSSVTWSKVSNKAIILSFGLFILVLNLLLLGPSIPYTHNSAPRTPPTLASDPPETSRHIPNYVHFVFILPEPEMDFTFNFKHFLSIYAAWLYWKPDLIYLHTNADTQGLALTRAREGHARKWSKLIFTMFDNLYVNTIEAPMHTNTGKEIHSLEHRSDFVRVREIYELSGMYIDFNVHALRDIRMLRESRFKNIAGRQLGGQTNSGVFISVKGGKMIKLWMHGMHAAYTGG